MNDAQSTIVGLKAQDCPGGGWNGMPAELEGRATVSDCLSHGVCGCIYGDAVQNIERLREINKALLVCCKVLVAQLEDSLAGVIDDRGHTFFPGKTDLELRPDGSFLLSHVRAAIAKAEAPQ